MKKILIRAGQSPFDNFIASRVYLDNTIGTNLGNLLYANSVYRNLMIDENVEIEADYYLTQKKKLTEAEMDKINSTYSLYVLPLADAFRNDFINQLEILTDFISRLKIPMLLIGVGIRAEIGEDIIHKKCQFDDAVFKFMKAVLEKSSIAGLRGNITCEYLKKLGFIEGKDIMPIGCPSVYTYGINPDLQMPYITKQSKIIVTNTVTANDNVRLFMRKILDNYENSYFIPQHYDELRELLIGKNFIETEKLYYPSSIDDKVFTENKSKFFLNVKTWQEFNCTADLSIGPRLHGNVSSLIKGVPTVFIVKDQRMTELIDFHHFPTVHQKEFTEKTTLEEVLNKADFSDFNIHIKNNFDNFRNFLKKNNIDFLYKQDDSVENSVFDQKVGEIDYYPPVEPFCCCSTDEKIRRFTEYTDYQDEKVLLLKKAIENKNKKIADLDKKNRELKNKIDVKN